MKNYHEILGLDREPFGNSPDPDFFHSSPRHAECLRRLEIAVRLRRGLCVVMGEVGTGKTTMCRRLIRTLSYDPAVSTHLLPDPSFEDPRDFLAAVAVSFGIRVDGEDSAARIREAIQEFLLDTAASGEKIVVLCVDEGQKITGACLEILRELLNFEVNTHKLVQIVVFAQSEFAGALRSRKNLADRVNTRLQLKALTASETRRLIRTRLRLAAGESWKDREPALFTRAALYAIHRACKGYPRRIMRLCHATLLETVGREKSRAGLSEVRAARRMAGEGGLSWRAVTAAVLPVAAVAAMLVGPGRERAVDMLDAGLLRMGEIVSKAPEALPEMPGYEDVRRFIASFDAIAPNEPSPTPQAVPDPIPLAVQEALPDDTAGVAAAPESELVKEPASAQAAIPAAVPAAAPLEAPVATPATPVPVSAPLALAAAENAIPPAEPEAVAVAGQGLPAVPAGFAPEVQRLVPDALPVGIAVAQTAPRLTDLSAEPAPVVIEVSAAPSVQAAGPAAAQPVAQGAIQPVTYQPAVQPVAAQAVAQPVPVQAVAQPTVQAASPVAVQPVAYQPAAQSVPVQPVAQPVQPVAQPTVQAASPAVAQPVAQGAIQPVTYQPAVQPVAYQPNAQPVPVQPVAQPTVQAASPAAAQPVAQGAIQPVTYQPAAQPVPVQAVAQPVQAVAQPVQAVAQPVQPVAQPTVQAASTYAPPRILGEVVVRPGWSLSKTAARLYGNGGRQVMAALAAANPGISDLDLVRPGHRVTFPVRQADPLPSGAWVVVLERHMDLDAAFTALARFRDMVPQTMLYAHFSPREGLAFDVVLDRYHADQTSAQRVLAELPRAAAQRAVAVEYADRATVAYSILSPDGTGGPGPVTTVAQNAATPR
ncbi:MAG: AAA family ATPase [Desulfovibrionaceae bacterium]|nr:AAA family ATPase [Desulfovibrionaceae bacterium]